MKEPIEILGKPIEIVDVFDVFVLELNFKGPIEIIGRLVLPILELKVKDPIIKN